MDQRDTWKRNGKQPTWFVELRMRNRRKITLMDRLERLSIPEPNSGCWLWLGSTIKGYGRIGYGKKVIMATHAALKVRGIEVPDGLFVCHHCDNPPCINPDHLFVGTAKDNMQDCVAKGRFSKKAVPLHFVARGDRHKSRTKPETIKRGEDHPDAKLTNEIVLSIRSDDRMATVIAAEYGVTPQAIHAVRKLKTWRHV